MAVCMSDAKNVKIWWKGKQEQFTLLIHKKTCVQVNTIMDKEIHIHTCSQSSVFEMLTAGCREGLRDGLKNDFT